MSDESVISSAPEGISPPSSQRTCFQRYITPFCLLSIITIVILAALFFYGLSRLLSTPHAQDIINLKKQTASLTSRLDQIETTSKTATTPPVNAEQIREFETRLATLQQQMEALQNQPKPEVSPEPIERSPLLNKELQQLSETQQVLKTAFLFWRLRTIVLTDEPYTAELADFKAAAKDLPDLPLLEKYADQGLKILKDIPEDLPPSSSEANVDSWWDRLKATTRSFIKVEKVDVASPIAPSYVQDRQNIEDILSQLDEGVSLQLKSLPQPLPPPLSPSPQSGDAL